jgi:hypothetical protein
LFVNCVSISALVIHAAMPLGSAFAWLLRDKGTGSDFARLAPSLKASTSQDGRDKGVFSKQNSRAISDPAAVIHLLFRLSPERLRG